MAKEAEEPQKPGGGVHLHVDQSAREIAPGGRMIGVEAQRIENLHVYGLQVAFAGLDWQPVPAPEDGTIPEPGDLPPGSRLDLLRSAVFTGRQFDLQSLAQAAAIPTKTEKSGNDAARSPIAVAGMGGAGKTGLAVEFCYRYGRSFYGVHWLDASQEPSLEIAACGVKMALQPWPDTLPEQSALTERLWQAEGAAGLLHLAVLDNVEDEARLRLWLPHLRGVQVLFTTRQAEWAADLGVHTHRLESLSPTESRLLLRRLAPRLQTEPDTSLDRLSARLGALPLGLLLAGSYLQEVEALAVDDYLEELEREGALSHESQVNWTAFTAGLRVTFELSWKRLVENKDTLAQHLFLAAGWCAPGSPIPEAVLASAAQEGETAVKASMLARGLKQLYNLGLLEKTQGGPKLHVLLGEFAQELDADKTGLARAAQSLAGMSEQAINSAAPAELAPLRAHVKAVAEGSEAAGLSSAGELWNYLGLYLQEFAEYSGARAAFERSLAFDTRLYGPEHPIVAIRINNLGSVLQELGDLNGARAAFEHSLRITKITYGPVHPQVASCENNLGRVMQAQGDLLDARNAFERALAIWVQVYGHNHPQVALGINNLGDVLRQSGDLQGAKAAFKQALQIDRQYYGPAHSTIASDLNSLGLVLHALGDLEGAYSAFNEAKQIWEPIYGSEHPKIATVENNLGLVLMASGNFPGARAAFERALAIDKKLFGPQHPKIAIRMGNLAQVLQALGDYSGARAAFETARDISEKFYGQYHPHVATAMNGLGLSLFYAGDAAGAQAAFEQALEISERIYGKDHSEVATILNNLASVLQAQGELPGAKSAIERSLGINQKIFGDEHPSVAAGLNTLGNLLHVSGDLDEARAAFKQALAILAKLLGPEHPNVATLVNNLGGVLKDMGDLREAQAAYVLALAIWRKALGEQHPQVAIGYNNLGMVLKTQGNLGEAQVCYEQALAILEKHLPPGHPDILTIKGNLEALAGG